MRDYARARKHVASAMRNGRSSFPAIFRYARNKDDSMTELDVFGALLLMTKLGEVEEVKHAKYWGTTELTALKPGLRAYYRHEA